MSIRTVTTENSVWVFDLDNELYRRVRRTDEPFPALITYSGEWEPYVELIEPGDHDFGDERLLVIRPVPFGEGRMRLTGYISDDRTEEVV